MASASSDVLGTRASRQAHRKRAPQRKRVESPPDVVSHQAAVHQRVGSRGSEGNGTLILLTLLFAVELFWFALVAYLLYRLL